MKTILVDAVDGFIIETESGFQIFKEMHDLVDELWLKIFPITLGSGKRLFAEGTIPAAFTLTDSKVSPKGVIVANYKRAGDVKTALVA